jgi:hypothetical protein
MLAVAIRPDDSSAPPVLAEWQTKCAIACEGTSSTPTKGGIHPRSKKQVGDRLGTACAPNLSHISQFWLAWLVGDSTVV